MKIPTDRFLAAAAFLSFAALTPAALAQCCGGTATASPNQVMSVAMNQPHDPSQPGAHAGQPGGAAPLGDPYPLGTCPITGKKLGSMGDPVVKAYDGREVRFCCSMCLPKFEKDQAKSIVKLDEAIVKDQTPYYPVTTSIVSTKELGAKPVDFVFNNRLVRLADEAEKAEFLKDPAKHLATLDKAVIAAQEKDYPLQDCPVSKESLGSMGEARNLVIANRLIRLCCKDCEGDARANPAKFIAMIDEARKGKAGKDAKSDKGDGHADHKK